MITRGWLWSDQWVAGGAVGLGIIGFALVWLVVDGWLGRAIGIAQAFRGPSAHMYAGGVHSDGGGVQGREQLHPCVRLGMVTHATLRHF